MATTTNYGWETPDDTDLVKDGALAQRTTASAIDTSLYNITGGKNVGLVPLYVGSFSGVTGVGFSNVFSNTYQFYKVQLQVYGSAGNQPLYARFTENGTPKSSGYYGASYVATVSGTLTYGDAYNNTSSFGFRYIYGDKNYINFELARPFTTQMFLTSSIIDGSQNQIAQMSVSNKTGSNFTGFDIFAPSGNIAGEVKIYGYRNSL